MTPEAFLCGFPFLGTIVTLVSFSHLGKSMSFRKGKAPDWLFLNRIVLGLVESQQAF